MLKISSSGTSDPGKKKLNEDNFYMNGIYVAEGNAVNGGLYSDNIRRKRQFYAVFDGIGEDIKSEINPNINFHDGQYASLIAADMLARLQRHLKTKQDYNLHDYIFRYVKKTNKSMCEYMQQKNIRAGVSFALLCFDNNSICAYNVGNSKIFILRENRITLLTQNDTKVESLITSNAWQVNADVARHTPDNKVLTQHLGIFDNEKNINLHINDKLNLRNGDKFLVCSDGLCDYLTTERIYQIMSRDMSELEIVRDLINEAMQNGGRDNLTVIVVGVNYADNLLSKANILKPTSNVMPNYTPLRYRTSFSLKPKHIKLLALVVGLLIVSIIAIAALSNVLFGGSDDPSNENGSGNEPPTESQSLSDINNNTDNTNNIVNTSENPSSETTEEEMYIVPPVDYDASTNTSNISEEQTTDPAFITTAAPVTLPPQNITAPPATSPPVTTSPPETTAAPVTETEEQTDVPAETTEEITEMTTETPTETEAMTEPETTIPPETTESETQPPETTTEEPPATEAPTDPPATSTPEPEPTPEPTIAAESPPDDAGADAE